MDNNRADTASCRSDIDPQWEENAIIESPPEVENGEPETAMLEPEFLPTIRNSRRDGVIFPDNMPDILDVAAMSLGLFTELERPQGHATAAPSMLEQPQRHATTIPPMLEQPQRHATSVPPMLEQPQRHATAVPPMLDGTNSIAPEEPTNDIDTHDKESINGESNANKLPSASGTSVSKQTDSQVTKSVIMGGPSQGLTYKGLKVQPWKIPSNSKGANASEINSPSHITPNPGQTDDVDAITFASPVLEDDEWIAPSIIDQVPEQNQGTQRRTIRQRIASVKQSVRQMTREDLQWMRGTISNVGIRSRALIAEPSEERASFSLPRFISIRKKGKRTSTMSLRGGTDRPEHQYYDLGVGSIVATPPQLRPPPYSPARHSTPSPGDGQRHGRPADYIHPLARNPIHEPSRENTQQSAVPEAATRRPMDGSSNAGKTVSRPADYLNPLAQHPLPEPSRENTQQSSVPEVASRNAMDRSTLMGKSTNSRQDSQGFGNNTSNEGNTPQSSRADATVECHVSNSNHNLNERHPEIPQIKITGPVSDALLDVPLPVVKKKGSLSTFGREAGKKIKAKVSRKFSTLRRKSKETAQEVPPEPEIAVREEIYTTNTGTGKFRSWHFGKKKVADVTTHF